MAQYPRSTEDPFNKLAFFRSAFINSEVEVFLGVNLMILQTANWMTKYLLRIFN